MYSTFLSFVVLFCTTVVRCKYLCDDINFWVLCLISESQLSYTTHKIKTLYNCIDFPVFYMKHEQEMVLKCLMYL